MFDLKQPRPVAPERMFDPLFQATLNGDEQTPEEVQFGEVDQALLDEEYLEAFAEYEKLDQAFCEAYYELVGKPAPGERAEREQTQREANLEANGGVKPDQSGGDQGSNGQGNGNNR